MIVIKIDLMIEQNVNSEFFIIETNMKVMSFIKKGVIYKYNKFNNNKLKNFKDKYKEKDGAYYDKYFGSYQDERKSSNLNKKDKIFLVSVFSGKKYCDFIFQYFRSSEKCFEFMKFFFELEKKFKLKNFDLNFLTMYLKKFKLKFRFFRIIFNNLFLNTKFFNYS